MTGKDVFLDSIEIQKRIPHRFPFLLIDRIISYHPGPTPGSRVGHKVVARKNVTFNEPYFTGHFPHMPVMPGVLQVEAMAQAGALACLSDNKEKLDVLIAKIDNCRFRRPVVPGDVLEIHAEITKERSGMIGVSCKALCDGEVVSEVDIFAKIFPRTETGL
ncbi:MAG: 3-hydroxyacyl-ACP dehydratase FabZ [Bdellovibrionales bacterium]|nr:3-hydroxyacyl-ACP dehydratase FabZ [Bdellovibrionales bacterium]